MKSRKVIILQKILRFLAVTVIKRHKPVIVAITGSVGKTSTKEAIYSVLSSKFHVRKNEKNYNNEIGVPLAIIGASSGGRSPWGWLKVFGRWLSVIIWSFDYPRYLVLEMGVDKPKDLKYLTSFVPVQIGVVTAVAPAHLETLGDLSGVAREKGRLVEALPARGNAILNADDELVRGMRDRTKAKILTYGFSPKADVQASDVSFLADEENWSGLSFKLNFEGKTVPIRLRRVMAPHLIYSALAAAAVGLVLKINLVEIAAALEEFAPPPGRMNFIAGIKNSKIVDDTYNSSPTSLSASLETLKRIKCRRRIVLLGDMLELGNEEKKEHEAAGRKVYELNADLFLVVGDRMKIAVAEARRLGFPADRIVCFEDPTAAGNFLAEKIEPDDLVLIKGSQSMRLEKAVEKVMAEPEKSRQLLCRQSSDWWKKLYKKP